MRGFVQVYTGNGKGKTTAAFGLATSRPAGTEIVVTGRYASPELMEIADLVTEMKEIKHYYHQGVQARKGIEF